MRTQQRRSDEEQNNRMEIVSNRWPRLRTLERFVCSENITDQAAATNSPDVCCLATGSKRSLVNTDSMVLPLCVAVFSRVFSPSLSFIHSCFCEFRRFRVGRPSAWLNGSLCPIRHFTSSAAPCQPAIHFVVVAMTPPRYANHDQHGRGSDVSGVGKSLRGRALWPVRQ